MASASATPRVGIDTFSSLNDFLPPECHVLEPEFIVECFEYDDERPLVMNQCEREVRVRRGGRSWSRLGSMWGRAGRRGASDVVGCEMDVLLLTYSFSCTK